MLMSGSCRVLPDKASPTTDAGGVYPSITPDQMASPALFFQLNNRRADKSVGVRGLPGGDADAVDYAVTVEGKGERPDRIEPRIGAVA